MESRRGRTLWFGSLLVAMLVTGCHKPTFEDLEPSTMKWSLAVVGTLQDEQQKQAVQKLADNVSQGSLQAEVAWTAPAEAGHTLEGLASRQGLDLVLVPAGLPNLQEVAAKHDMLRFAVLGDPAEPALPNVRHLTLDKKRLYFLAGFLAGEANRQTSEPFTVLVDQIYRNTDEEWQWILAGSRLAGRKDIPVQVQAAAFLPPDDSENGNGTRSVFPRPQTVNLSGKAMVLTTPVPDAAWTRIRQEGVGVIRTGESFSALPEGTRVLAEPLYSLTDALREEAAELTGGKWAGRQKVTLPSKRVYQLPNPNLFPDKGGIATRLELFEEQLAAGSLQPEADQAAQPE